MVQMETDRAAEFAAATEPHRKEVLAHCYRMLGSADDAEDLVQETYLKAWRAYGDFEQRSSVRTWLYRIATNACLSALRRHERRVLPSGLGSADADVRWVQPIPDSLITPGASDPAEAAVSRDSLRLALIACIQQLPPLQRAVFLLRDVLKFRAGEVADLLDTSIPAVKSALQRARARVAEIDPYDAAGSPATSDERALLDAFITAFETADAAAFTRLLTTGASLEIPPATTWYSGRATCVPVLEAAVGRSGDWMLVPTSANGQPAAVSYLRDDDVRRAFGAVVLTVTPAGISRIVSYHDPALATRFGLPLVHGEDPR